MPSGGVVRGLWTLSPRTYQESIEIAASPETVYALVSDVTRVGEWSPVCQKGWWEADGGPRVGATFKGRNVTPDRTWDTTSTVTAAEPGRAFAWTVGRDFVHWGYRLEPTAAGTKLTESWEFTTTGQEFFVSNFGEKAPGAIEGATQAAHDGIPATLNAIKRIAEA